MAKTENGEPNKVYPIGSGLQFAIVPLVRANSRVTWNSKTQNLELAHVSKSDKQLFAWDDRTRSMRLFVKKTLAIGGAKNYDEDQ